ncbi:unnamed protein product [Rotaria magnacalcarata]|uniref:Uncharacterized protein n=1 Tax=Rotaria magnacalcarata TaxID=392030 RepID=A0A815SNI5_9BILA|nr:unnamed protein product [Rotaria magnacalcarata]CAF4115012.1 unnamed protein product [Rotaria magnacalcarata]CAF4979789.1 unnamed protein product [Rotaria magnacalcarata]
MYAVNSNNELDKVSIVFEINVDQSIRNTAHFADIQSLSNIDDESEYLSTMESVFRIDSVKKSSTNGIRFVKLELTSDNDPDLVRLTYSIRSLVISEKMSHTHIGSLALLMMIMDEKLIGTIYASLSERCYVQGKYESALVNMEIALGIEQRCLAKSDERQLTQYSHIMGQIHAKLCNNSEALTYYELSIKIGTH